MGYRTGAVDGEIARNYSLREVGEFTRAKRGVTRDVVTQPAEMTAPVDHQDALVWRIHQPRDVAVDAHVAAEPVGHQISARPAPGSPKCASL